MRKRKSTWQDLTGRTFGRLTVKALHPERKRQQCQWECLCVCGKMTVVPSVLLLGGKTTSCGCYRAEKVKGPRLAGQKHGEGSNGKETPEYRVWRSMRCRCNSPTHDMYRYYGARGITICERWGDYKAFLEDMGRRPSPRHSLDRIDNSGNYEPNNCRWATTKVQNNNKRPPTKTPINLITLRGEAKTMTAWAQYAGISVDTVRQRLRRGIGIEEALFTPPLSKPAFKVKPPTQEDPPV